MNNKNGMNAAIPNVTTPTINVPNSAAALSPTPSPGSPVAPMPPRAETPTEIANTMTGFAITSATRSSSTFFDVSRNGGKIIDGNPNATA